jgi:hypothetical protein
MFGPEILRVFWIAAVFEGDKVVFLVAGWVIGVRNAPGSIDFSRVWVDKHLPVHLKSPNAIDPAQTLTAFLIAVLAGARRFAHTSLLRADHALHAGLARRIPTRPTTGCNHDTQHN